MATFFVNRPIVAMVISILIVLLGLVAMDRLPVAQYPEITPPEVVVEGTYTGASAVDVELSVATPTEQKVNGVESMIYMKSINSADGKMALRVAFEVGTDLDNANMLTQNRVNEATPQLPEEVKRLGISVKKSLAFPIILVTLTSPDGTYDNNFLSNYMAINVNDALARIQGIGQVMLFGGSDYAMRVWVRPDQLRRYSLTIPDLSRAIQEQNVIAPGGQVGAEPAPPGTEFTYTVRTQGRLETAEEFGEIILRSNPDGSQVRLKDVARLELGTQFYNMIGRLNGKAAAVVALYQTPGTNALEIADRIKSTMEELAQRFPEDLEHTISLDTTLAIEAGIDEIIVTLYQAIALVILVVFVFLQNFRATLIPLVTVPVSLIGALVAFPILGFSINTLTLLGLVLAIGTVVDDAIVVVEAVMAKIETGMSPREATIAAMREVTGPVIATSLVLMAVFVPVAFMGGITGRLYQQFAITIAVSVAFSSVNALTLSPALASKLLRPKGDKKSLLDPFYNGFNRVFDWVSGIYLGIARLVVTRWAVGLLLIALLVGGIVWLGGQIPGGFVPEEDQGYIMINVQLPDASSLQRSDEVSFKIESILGETEGIKSYTTVVGYSMLTGSANTNNSFFFIELENWEERPGAELFAKGIVNTLNGRFAREIPDAIAFAFGPPAIPGLGTGSGFSFMLQDRSGQSPEYLEQQARAFIGAASERQEIGGAITTYSSRVPQLYAATDRESALKRGVSIDDLNTTLGANFGGAYVNDFNRFGRLYKVYIQAEPEYRSSPEELSQFFVRNRDGGMVPLTTLVDLEPASGPAYTNRFNLFRSAEIIGAPAPGFSSTQALDALEETAADVLPSGMSYAWNAMSYQEKAAAGTAGVVLLFAMVCVFLILAAQYESWSMPFSILLGTPFAVFGAFLGLWIGRFFSTSYENNVFAQIGVVMLIGLAAKNAILIVEFAKAKTEEGMDPVTAALEAAKQRFRAILMTALSFVFGVLPLLVATGAGAEARKVMGIAVFAGMLAATFLGVFFVPLLFVVVEKLRGGGKKAATAEASAGGGAPDMRRVIGIALLLLLVASCKLGPDYRRPVIQTPEEFAGEADTENLANVDWWDLFHDPVLQSLIDTALEHNQTLQAAAWRIDEARANLGFVKADMYPSFNMQATARRTSPSDEVLGLEFDDFNTFGAVAGVSWEADLWGKFRRSNESARAQMFATQWGQRALVVSLVSEVARGYFLLRDLDARLEISRRTLESRKKQTELVRNRFEGGIVSELDVRQAEVQEAIAAAAVPRFERQIVQTENALSLLLGRPPSEMPRGEELVDQELPEEPPKGIPSELLQRRPDVRQTELLLHAQMARIGVAQALRWPSLSLTGALGLQSQELSNFTSGGTWNVGASLVAPLFEFGKNKRRVEVERARTEQAILGYEATVLDAFREVEDALVAIRTWRDEYDARVFQRTAAKEANRLSWARYDGGVTSYLEVLQTESALFNAQLDASRSLQEHYNAVITLYAALGGGWDAEQVVVLPESRIVTEDE